VERQLDVHGEWQKENCGARFACTLRVAEKEF